MHRDIIYKYLKFLPSTRPYKVSSLRSAKIGPTLSRMAFSDFNEVKIYEDTVNDLDIIRGIIDSEDKDEPFYTLDVANIVEKHQNWIRKLPRVTPHYAVKCNPHPTIIKILAALNASFDCASQHEIRQVIRAGVPGERIIYANTAKSASYIKFAKKMNVARMTVDSEFELLKIKEVFPEAKIIIRIRCDAKITSVLLGTKFGCDPGEEAVRLIHFAKNIGLSLYGFSFHVGSPCGELNAYSRGIATCKRLITIARSIGCKDCNLIDIGGGFSGTTGSSIDKLASIVNDAIRDVDSSIEIISEPGQYYVSSALTLASYLHSKRIVTKEDKIIRMYYMSCGVYGSFLEELRKLKARMPTPLYEPNSDEQFPSVLWGPTCDSSDYILKDIPLPELHIGDWLVWKDMGAYTLSLACNFNGFMPPTVYPIIRKSQWNEFKAYVSSLKLSKETIQWNDGLDSLEYIESR